MLKEKYPEVQVSYETYRNIFNAEYNIAFGYPQTDTCSKCDLFIAKKSSLDAELLETTDDATKQKLQLDIQQQLELSSDKAFYLLVAEE